MPSFYISWHFNWNKNKTGLIRFETKKIKNKNPPALIFDEKWSEVVTLHGLGKALCGLIFSVYFSVFMKVKGENGCC